MIEAGKEILKNTKDLFYQEVEKRFSNPFLWAFVLAWVFCNWDFLYIVLFLDEQYVSLIPDALNWKQQMVTKYEYIKSTWIVNWYKFLFYPFVASFLFVLFVEWVASSLNIFVKNIREKFIEKNEIINTKKHEKLKDNFVESWKRYRERTAMLNEEIIILQAKNDELEFSIDDKVNERLKDEEKKNIRRIKELEWKNDSISQLVEERLEDNKILTSKNSQLKESLSSVKDRDENYKTEIALLTNDRRSAIKRFNQIQKENTELKKRLEEIDKPIDESLKDEYLEFKNNDHFETFGDLVDTIESNSYSVKQEFLWKYLKYLTLKWIIEEIRDNDGDVFYQFAPKWDKFVEFYLDETFSWKWKKNMRKSEEVSVEDLPF